MIDTIKCVSTRHYKSLDGSL